MSTNTSPRQWYRPLVALRAVRALLKDPEDTGKVFVAIRAMSGPSDARNFQRFEASEMGRTILAERRSLIDLLNDRDALARMPEGSLGRRYLNFVQGENLTADGLVAASEEPGEREEFTDAQRLYSDRIRDMHDLWHVTAGYGRDGLGELSLLAFSYAQLGNLGIAMIIWFGARAGSKDYPKAGVWRAVREGYRLGRRATWWAAEDWEALLPLPIEEVRRRLGAEKPLAYREAVARVDEIERARGAPPMGPQLAA